MEKESHIQWALYDVDHYDYYISLNKETLEKIKEWNIIKSKIVYSSYDYEQNKKMVQKKLFITLLTEKERRKNRWETKFIRTDEKVWLKISNYLLNNLIEANLEDYEHRYDAMWNKIHFLINETEEPFSDKWWFDNTFISCETLNKRLPTEWDLFESDYINVYNKPQ
jgi:hypothetical protein